MDSISFITVGIILAPLVAAVAYGWAGVLYVDVPVALFTLFLFSCIKSHTPTKGRVDQFGLIIIILALLGGLAISLVVATLRSIIL